MKILIVPTDRIEKLRFPHFDGWDTIEPQAGVIDGIDVMFLPESLKQVEKFSKVLADFEVCEIKDIETIEQVYYDSKSAEIKPGATGKYIVDSKKVDIMTLEVKTILTIAKVIVK